MSEQAGVYAKVQKVSADLEEIPKTGYNEHFGYKYHEADKVMAELRPLLAEHGLVIIPHQVGIEDATVQTKSGDALLTTVKHELEVVDTEDGSRFTFTVFGRGQDGADKGPTKAYTMAYKYGVMKLFGIASSQSDPDAGAPAERASSDSNESPFDCPDCGGPVWDNTDDPKAALNEGDGNRPSYKCRDDDCDWATWPADEDTLDAIGDAVSELRGWDQEAGDKAGRLVSAKQGRINASADFAESVLGKIERRVEEAKDAVEQETDAKQARTVNRETVQVGESGKWMPPTEDRPGKVWADGGSTSLPNADTRREAERLVARVEEDGEVVCAGCEEWVPKDDTHGRWASRYCDQNGCWDEYKANNSTTCKLCGSPEWRCYC